MLYRGVKRILISPNFQKVIFFIRDSYIHFIDLCQLYNFLLLIEIGFVEPVFTYKALIKII